MLISNEAVKVADLQKSASQLMQNDVLVIEMVNNPFSESKKNFVPLIKRECSNQNENKGISRGAKC